MITFTDSLSPTIGHLSQALGVLNTVANIPDLRGEDAANFLADAFDVSSLFPVITKMLTQDVQLSSYAFKYLIWVLAILLMGY